jgi:ribosomal protein S18 acetylase RimI-like enzyme
MEISEIEDREIAAAISLWKRCNLVVAENDPRADIDRARRADNATILVGRRGDAVIATAMVGFDGHRGWVYYLAVQPELQRSGLGKAMLNAAEQWLRARGAPKLLLTASEENAAAFGFYKALGFARSPVVVLGKRLDRSRQ